MGLGFVFDEKVNPKKPADVNDPPPDGWDTAIDTDDYRRALFGFPTDLFLECCHWEKREIGRKKQ